MLTAMVFAIGIETITAQPQNRKAVDDFLEYATKLSNYDDSTVIRLICRMSQYDEQYGRDSINSMLNQRKIVLNTHINSTIANMVSTMLAYYDSLNNNDIKLYINSPGGNVIAGLGIYDTMLFVNSDIQTICTGMAASMSFVLLSAGTKGKRGRVKSGRFFIHNPEAGFETSDLNENDKDFAKTEIQELRNEILGILVKHTGQSSSRIDADMNKSTWIRASEGIDYGIIDYIIE